MRIMKADGATMDNDANGCFDRIIHALEAIDCQTLGATVTSCKVLSGVWQEQHHQIKIDQSISDDLYP
jgi:hypothetical protein